MLYLEDRPMNLLDPSILEQTVKGTIKGLTLTSNVIAEGQENALLDVVADVKLW